MAGIKDISAIVFSQMLAHIKHHIKLARKILIISTLSLLAIFLLIYFVPTSPEIIVLGHMTEYHDGRIDQICLVKNPPRKSKDFYDLVEVFNKMNPTEDGLFNRLFIKEHDYELPIFPFPNNIDYTSETTSRDDLDNVDFLADSYASVHGVSGEIIKLTKVYVGELYYYEE